MFAPRDDSSLSSVTISSYKLVGRPSVLNYVRITRVTSCFTRKLLAIYFIVFCLRGLLFCHVTRCYRLVSVSPTIVFKYFRMRARFMSRIYIYLSFTRSSCSNVVPRNHFAEFFPRRSSSVTITAPAFEPSNERIFIS